MYNTKAAFEDEFLLIIPVKKPRQKQLHDALLERPAGKMKNPKNVSRTKQKEELRRACQEEV